MKNGLKVTWLISICIAFLFGYSLSPNVTPNQIKTTKPVELTKIKGSDSHAEDRSQLTETSTLKPLDKTIVVKPDLNVLVDDLKALLDGGGLSLNVSSIAEAYGLIKNLTENELLAMLDLMKGKLNELDNIHLLSLLTGRLALFDPIKTLSFINEYVEKPQVKASAIMSALSEWVKTDPESAYYWYMNADNGLDKKNNYYSVGLIAIFNGLASKAPDIAFDKLIELDHSGTDVKMAALGFSQSLEYKSDFIQFIARADALDNITIKKTLINNWAMKTPTEVIEWSDTVTNLGQKKIIQADIYSTWSVSEPVNAANWYINKASNVSEKESQATTIIQMWSMQDPATALSWLDQQTNFDTQKPIAQLLNSSTYRNPQFAIENLDRLNSDKDKAAVSYQIYRSLEKSSPEKAAKFLESSLYKQEVISKHERMEKYKKKRENS